MSELQGVIVPQQTFQGAIPESAKQIPGPPGPQGPPGEPGPPGQDGYTPVRGTDYWTEDDKAEIIADVIASLPVYDGEVVEE